MQTHNQLSPGSFQGIYAAFSIPHLLQGDITHMNRTIRQKARDFSLADFILKTMTSLGNSSVLKEVRFLSPGLSVVLSLERQHYPISCFIEQSYC